MLYSEKERERERGRERSSFNSPGKVEAITGVSKRDFKNLENSCESKLPRRILQKLRNKKDDPITHQLLSPSPLTTILYLSSPTLAIYSHITHVLL
jgi:hypothetical protein